MDSLTQISLSAQRFFFFFFNSKHKIIGCCKPTHFYTTRGALTWRYVVFALPPSKQCLMLEACVVLKLCMLPHFSEHILYKGYHSVYHPVWSWLLSKLPHIFGDEVNQKCFSIMFLLLALAKTQCAS